MHDIFIYIVMWFFTDFISCEYSKWVPDSLKKSRVNVLGAEFWAKLEADCQFVNLV